MSGIYGFICSGETDKENKLHALDYWNSFYGHEAEDQSLFETSGIGCHIEHLSDNYPFTAKIIENEKENTFTVLDVILYNREELASSLGISLEELKHLSDEELLYRVYTEKGYQALATLNGDFAGAIYNREEESWTLLRDHLGIRPLYYYLDDKMFAFSTDIRGLTALPEADLSFNEEMLYKRLAGYSTQSATETYFAHIHCVPTASCMEIKRDKEQGFSYKSDCYWKPGQKKIRLKDDKAYQKELCRLITDAVQRRLDAVTGLVGSELSGGLDSGIISILIHRLHRDCVYHSWSYDPEEHPIRHGQDEREVILGICRQEQINCHFIPLPTIETVGEFKKDMEEIQTPDINTRDLGEGSAWMRSQGTRVVFTGHGGDEGVSHRSKIYELWYHHEYLPYVKETFCGTKGKKLRILRTIRRCYNQVRDGKKDISSPLYSEVNAQPIMNDDFQKRMEDTFCPPLLFAYDPLTYNLEGGSRNRLDNIAVQGAENGVRYLVPYLDYRVFDYAVSIPRNQYMRNNVDRWIFRQAFDHLMPEELREMDYKIIYSHKNVKLKTPENEPIIYSDKAKELYEAYLDWNLWKPYLSKEGVEQMDVLTATKENMMQWHENNWALYECCLMQNLIKESKKCKIR